MAKSIDSTLPTKASSNIDVSKDLEKPQEKSIAELINEEEENKEENEPT